MYIYIHYIHSTGLSKFFTEVTLGNFCLVCFDKVFKMFCRFFGKRYILLVLKMEFFVFGTKQTGFRNCKIVTSSYKVSSLLLDHNYKFCPLR
jgi:hypothetical protein